MKIFQASNTSVHLEQILLDNLGDVPYLSRGCTQIAAISNASQQAVHLFVMPLNLNIY